MNGFRYISKFDTFSKRHTPEQHLQQWYVIWLRSQGLLANASVSAIKVSRGVAIKMKRAGYRAGFPDIQILEPRGPWHGMFVELKVGQYPAPQQKEWRQELLKRKYYAIIVPGNLSYRQAQDYLAEETEKYLRGQA